MPKVIVLPHETLCPEGQVIEANQKISLCDLLIKNGIGIEHACDQVCACTTCHIYVREGQPKNEASEAEEDRLDQAWGLEPDSRLSCQAIVGEKDLVIEIPKYTINMVSENH